MEEEESHSKEPIEIGLIFISIGTVLVIIGWFCLITLIEIANGTSYVGFFSILDLNKQYHYGVFFPILGIISGVMIWSAYLSQSKKCVFVGEILGIISLSVGLFLAIDFSNGNSLLSDVLFSSYSSSYNNFDYFITSTFLGGSLGIIGLLLIMFGGVVLFHKLKCPNSTNGNHIVKILTIIIIITIIISISIYPMNSKGFWLPGHQSSSDRIYTNHIDQVIFPKNITPEAILNEFAFNLNLLPVTNITTGNSTHKYGSIYWTGFLNDSSKISIDLYDDDIIELCWCDIPEESEWKQISDSPLDNIWSVLHTLSITDQMIYYDYSYLGSASSQSYVFKSQYDGIYMGKYAVVNINENAGIESFILQNRIYVFDIPRYLSEYGAMHIIKQNVSDNNVNRSVHPPWVAGLSIIENKLCYWSIVSMEGDYNFFQRVGYVDVQNGEIVKFKVLSYRYIF